MPVQALTQVDPNQFFNLPSSNGTGTQRLDTKVSGVAISKDLSGLLSVTTAEGDKITLTADLEARYRAVSYQGHAEGDGTSVDVRAKSVEYSLKKQYGVTVEGDLNEQELHDLEKLFRKVSNIFRKFFRGQDEDALAKTARLAERFGNLSSLSSLDLTVDVERSVTVFAAQVASEVTGQPELAAGRPDETSATTAPAVQSAPAATPGGAPATIVATPQSSTGTTAPTPSSTDAPAQDASKETHLSVAAPEAQKPTSLAQQILDALEDARVESRKVRKYLPDFLRRLREDLSKELRGEREDRPSPVNEVQTPAPSSLYFAYQATSRTSVSLSIRT